MFSKPIEIISSVKNEKIRNLTALREGKNRRKQKVFVVEGAREISRALQCGWDVQTLFVCPELVTEKSEEELKNASERLSTISYFEITADVFSKSVFRESVDGMIATFKFQENALEAFSEYSSILVVEKVEKPGNLGALLRSADGLGINGIVLLDSPIDSYGPQTVRSSLGALFSVPIVKATFEELISFGERNQINWVAADPHASIDLGDFRFPMSKVGILLGSESDGIDQRWFGQANFQSVKIPMLGICDSLNVSVSGAIMMYEAVKQQKNQ